MKALYLMIAAGLFALSACNTVQGMGEDVSTAGDTMSETAAETQQEL